MERMLRIRHLIRHSYRRAAFSLAVKRPPFVTCGDISPACRGNLLKGKAGEDWCGREKSRYPNG